jgi:hypothetical protein
MLKIYKSYYTIAYLDSTLAIGICICKRLPALFNLGIASWI